MHFLNHAVLEYVEYESVADTDYHVLYSLSLDELGLFSMSTYLNSTDIPDEFGNGFFTFIAEPDGSETNIMDKVFTLIIDRSGSMGGDKIVQARAASSFIVENLNEGDRFNLDVNHQLLTLMASENQGLSVFLEDDEVEDVISNFYLMIRNPDNGADNRDKRSLWRSVPIHEFRGPSRCRGRRRL